MGYFLIFLLIVAFVVAAGIAALKFGTMIITSARTFEGGPRNCGSKAQRDALKKRNSTPTYKRPKFRRYGNSGTYIDARPSFEIAVGVDGLPPSGLMFEA